MVILELALEILREGIVDVLKQDHDTEAKEEFLFKQEGDVLASVPVLELVINSQVELEVIAHDLKVPHIAVSDLLGLLQEAMGHTAVTKDVAVTLGGLFTLPHVHNEVLGLWVLLGHQRVEASVTDDREDGSAVEIGVLDEVLVVSLVVNLRVVHLA